MKHPIGICEKCGITFHRTSKHPNTRFCSVRCIVRPPRKKQPLADRFWPKVKIGSPDECWEWQAATLANGYGYFGGAGPNNSHMLAHRTAWVLTNGSISDGLWVCHRCDNRKCVNPAHLFVGTRQDNVDDMVRKGRQRHPPIKLVCKHGHQKTPENVILRIQNGYVHRTCRTCELLRQKLHQRRLRATRILLAS